MRFWICKVVALLIAAGSLSEAQSVAQAATVQTGARRVTVDAKNATLLSVLEDISNQAGTQLFYTSSKVSLNQKVNVQVKNSTVQNALNAVVRGTNVKAVLDANGETITIAPVKVKAIGNGVISGKV